MVIASRKLERLKEAAEELVSQISPVTPSMLTALQCNIRKEEEVSDTAAHNRTPGDDGLHQF